MEKIKLEICCGTTCHMLGAHKIATIESLLPEDWRDKVDVSASPCLDLCMSENLAGAPYVRLNGRIIGKASVELIMDEIRKLMEAQVND